jgi:hypothetical protein
MEMDETKTANGRFLILRFFSDGRPAKRVKIVETLAEAQAHCSRPATRGFIAGRGGRDGAEWFDGYTEIKKENGL